MILKILNKPESLITFVKDRPGHDFRYSLKIDKIKKLGWKPSMSLKEGLKKTVHWYLKNEWWWKKLICSSMR
jgi:dTDP-glucose 4,6-dehydratase